MIVLVQHPYIYPLSICCNNPPLFIWSTITHWPQISLMQPSNILALSVTTICCVHGDMHTKSLIILCMSTQPISIHASVSVCGITKPVSLEYSVDGLGVLWVLYVSKGKIDCVSACEWMCVYLSQGATVSLRHHECGPESVWHRLYTLTGFTLSHTFLNTHLERFGACSCILHL